MGPWIFTKSTCHETLLSIQKCHKNHNKKHTPKKYSGNPIMAVIPWKIQGWDPKNGGLLQMISLFNWVIFRFQPLILKGVISWKCCTTFKFYPLLKAWNRIQHRKGSSDSQSRLKNLKAQAFLRSNNQALYQLLFKCLGVEKVDKQMRQTFFWYGESIVGMSCISTNGIFLSETRWQAHCRIMVLLVNTTCVHLFISTYGEISFACGFSSIFRLTIIPFTHQAFHKHRYCKTCSLS